MRRAVAAGSTRARICISCHHRPPHLADSSGGAVGAAWVSRDTHIALSAGRAIPEVAWLAPAGRRSAEHAAKSAIGMHLVLERGLIIQDIARHSQSSVSVPASRGLLPRRHLTGSRASRCPGSTPHSLQCHPCHHMPRRCCRRRGQSPAGTGDNTCKLGSCGCDACTASMEHSTVGIEHSTAQHSTRLGTLLAEAISAAPARAAPATGSAVGGGALCTRSAGIDVKGAGAIVGAPAHGDNQSRLGDKGGGWFGQQIQGWAAQGSSCVCAAVRVTQQPQESRPHCEMLHCPGAHSRHWPASVMLHRRHLLSVLHRGKGAQRDSKVSSEA